MQHFSKEPKNPLGRIALNAYFVSKMDDSSAMEFCVNAYPKVRAISCCLILSAFALWLQVFGWAAASLPHPFSHSPSALDFPVFPHSPCLSSLAVPDVPRELCDGDG